MPKIKRLLVSAISIVTGCLQRKVKLKNSDLANVFQLKQFLKEPTRITCQTVIKFGVDHVGMSDHSLVYPRKQPKIVNTRQFKHNVEAYKQDLAKVLQNQSQDFYPNTLCKEWKEKFLLVADMHAPPVTRRVRSEHAPWLTSEIKRKIYDWDFLKKKISQNWFS